MRKKVKTKIFITKQTERINMEQTEEIIGYCIYCLEEISNEETYLVKDDNLYHLYCYKLKFPNDIGEDYE